MVMPVFLRYLAPPGTVSSGIIVPLDNETVSPLCVICVALELSDFLIVWATKVPFIFVHNVRKPVSSKYFAINYSPFIINVFSCVLVFSQV